MFPPNTLHVRNLQALVLDWAGTTVDYGSLAPVKTLQQIFASAGIELTDSEARRNMGLPKKEHIRSIFGLPRVCGAWQTLQGAMPSDADVENMFAAFIPRQLSCLVECSGLIPGVADAVQRFRQRGLKIGSTTGYTRVMLDLLVENSARAGYCPDCSLAPEDVGTGRPSPFMIFEIAVRLKVYPMAAIAKVGDTPADIQEGLNAGAWTIGVAGTGNCVGLSQMDFQALSVAEQERRLAKARAELQDAGAHYVIDSLAELDPALDDINARLQSASILR